MKSSSVLTLTAALGLTSCAQIASTLQEPITSDYNPLDGPNAPSLRNKSFQQTGPSYNPGQWVETAMPNSTFFYKIPRGNATADQVLSKGSPLKVVSTKGSYLKVELEGGTVGYVPAIMVAEPSTSTDSTPFLPPPPTAPLQRSNTDSFAPPSVPAVTPGDSSPLAPGSSVIPPPSRASTSTAPGPLAPGPVVPSGSATEVVIPTTPSPVVEMPAPVTPSNGGIIPAPYGASSSEESIGIE